MKTVLFSADEWNYWSDGKIGDWLKYKIEDGKVWFSTHNDNWILDSPKVQFAYQQYVISLIIGGGDINE